MKPILILILFTLALTALVFDYIDTKFQIRRNTELHFIKKQAPLIVNVTGPYTTIIKTPKEFLLVEQGKLK